MIFDSNPLCSPSPTYCIDMHKQKMSLDSSVLLVVRMPQFHVPSNTFSRAAARDENTSRQYEGRDLVYEVVSGELRAVLQVHQPLLCTIQHHAY